MRAEIGLVDDAETVVVAFGTPAQVREVRDPAAARRRAKVGYVRPITLWPFPSTRCARPRGCAGRRVVRDLVGADGRRRAHRRGGRRAGRVHRRRVDRRLGLRRRPPARRRRGAASASSRCTRADPNPPFPATPSSPTSARRAPRGGYVMSTHAARLGPVIDSSAPPRAARAVVEAHKPDLLLTDEHTCARAAANRSRCGCSSRRSRSSGSRSGRSSWPASGATRCSAAPWTSISVQALHGRAPSVATGMKRMRPDAIVFTLQGDGDMVNEGLQEVLHTAARGESVTCILLNNGVFGETGGHMTATSVIGQRTKNTLDGRDAEYHGYPILIGDLISRARGRGVRGARLGAQRGRGRAHEEDVPAGLRDAGSRRGLLVRRGAHDVPHRLVHPDRRRARLPPRTLGEVHVMGELKVDGVVKHDRGAPRGEHRPAAGDRGAPRRRRPARLTPPPSRSDSSALREHHPACAGGSGCSSWSFSPSSW